MTKYFVSLPIYASAFIEVEADSEDEAIEKGFEEMGMPSICHQCSNEVELGEFMDEGAYAEKIE